MLTPRRLLARTVHAAQAWIERAGAIQPGTDAAERFGSFGAGSFIDFPTGAQFGVGSIHIGVGTLIGKRVSLHVGYTPDDVDRPERGLVIGDRCVIGAGSRLSAHESIEVGDDVWFASDVFISDGSHGYQDIETPIGQQLAAPRPVRIGSGTWIGHGAIIVPGTQIGAHVVIGAGTVVSGKVPDHTVVVGSGSRVVREWVPEVGWRSTSSGDVRPAWTAAEAAILLAGGTLPDRDPSAP